MMISNAGNRIMNTWLYPIQDGWVMIDTGYENSYIAVVKKLRKLHIQPEDIHYLFLTHAHDDHAGFLEEWMNKHPHTQIITHRQAISGLRRGQNRFAGGCSTLVAFLFCQFMALLGNSEHRYPRLSEEHLAKIITLNEDMTFNYLESANSTHLGKGTWSVTESTVTLYEEEGDRTFIFKVSQNSLLYDKANSSEFPSTKLEDGASFSYIENLE